MQPRSRGDAGNPFCGAGFTVIHRIQHQFHSIRDPNLVKYSKYNVVVHSVDGPAHDILIKGNQCIRGGVGGELSAAIALIGVQRTTVRDNLVQQAYGAGILVVDLTRSSGNRVGRNRLVRNGLGQHLPAVVWQHQESHKSGANP